MTAYNLTQYPIACMAMNRVSDLKLAQAVRRGGALPSLSVFNYFTITEQGRAIDHNKIKLELNAYQTEFGDMNIIVSTGVVEFLQPAVFKVLEDSLPKIIELIIEKENSDRLPELFEKIKLLRSQGCLFFKKTLGAGDTEHVMANFDGLVVKGNEGAGTVEVSHTLEENFKKVKDKFPDKMIIPNGGIGNAEQVKYYLDRGAFAVGVGTLFAAAEESCVSLETKQKLINATSADLKLTSQGARQQGLMFTPVASENRNNTQSLAVGVKTGQRGHMLAGKGIDSITAILPAAEIIKNLIL